MEFFKPWIFSSLMILILGVSPKSWSGEEEAGAAVLNQPSRIGVATSAGRNQYFDLSFNGAIGLSSTWLLGLEARTCRGRTVDSMTGAISTDVTRGFFLRPIWIPNSNNRLGFDLGATSFSEGVRERSSSATYTGNLSSWWAGRLKTEISLMLGSDVYDDNNSLAAVRVNSSGATLRQDLHRWSFSLGMTKYTVPAKSRRVLDFLLNLPTETSALLKTTGGILDWAASVGVDWQASERNGFSLSSAVSKPLDVETRSQSISVRWVHLFDDHWDGAVTASSSSSEIESQRNSLFGFDLNYLF